MYLIERIIQAGKKKLVLDHVIVQKMDDEEGGTDVRSILTHGALALFDEAAASREINCTLERPIRNRLPMLFRFGARSRQVD